MSDRTLRITNADIAQMSRAELVEAKENLEIQRRSISTNIDTELHAVNYCESRLDQNWYKGALYAKRMTGVAINAITKRLMEIKADRKGTAAEELRKYHEKNKELKNLNIRYRAALLEIIQTGDEKARAIAKGAIE